MQSFHVGQAFVPPAFFVLRQIGDWTFFAVKFLEMPEHSLSCLRNEAATHPHGKVKLVSLVIADQECIKTFRAWAIADNDKFLPAADAHFHPGAPTGLTAAV